MGDASVGTAQDLLEKVETPAPFAIHRKLRAIRVSDQPPKRVECHERRASALEAVACQELLDELDHRSPLHEHMQPTVRRCPGGLARLLY
eukprot:4003197-Amphidinium_carterae.1